MASTGKGAEGGTPSDLHAAVAQILGADGQVAGAGFLVAVDVLVTCAHVVRAAGSGAGEPVRATFPHVVGADGAGGTRRGVACTRGRGRGRGFHPAA